MEAMTNQRVSESAEQSDNSEREEAAPEPGLDPEVVARFRRLLDGAEERIRQTGGVKHDDCWASPRVVLGAADR